MNKLEPILSRYEYETGNSAEDLRTQGKMKQLLNVDLLCSPNFDETVLFGGKEKVFQIVLKIHWLDNFFENLGRVKETLKTNIPKYQFDNGKSERFLSIPTQTIYCRIAFHVRSAKFTENFKSLLLARPLEFYWRTPKIKNSMFKEMKSLYGNFFLCLSLIILK